MAGIDPTLAMTHGMSGFGAQAPGLASPTAYGLSSSGVNMMGTAYEGGINFAQMGAFTAAPVMAGMGGRLGQMGKAWRAADMYRPAMAGMRTGWGAGRAFGAARGMGMIGRTAMGIGAASAMAVPPLALAMAATETAIEFGSQATGHWQNQQMGQAIMANAAPMGMEYGRGGAQGFGVHLADTAKSMGTDVSQLNSLVQSMSSSGQMTGVRDMKEFKTKFKQVLDGIKEVATLTQGTLEDAQQTFSTLRQQGFYKTADVTAQAVKTEARAAAGGLTSGQMLQVGQAGADMYRQMGMRGRVGSDITSFNAMAVNRAFETGGMNEEAVMEMGGPMAVAGMMSQAPAMMMRKSSKMRRLMAASLGEADPVTGARSIDMDRMAAGMAGNMPTAHSGAYAYAGTAEAHEQFAPHGAAMMVSIGTRGTSNIHEGQRKMMKTFGMSRDQALLMMQGVGAQRQGHVAERGAAQHARDQAGLRLADEQSSLGYRMGAWWNQAEGVEGFRGAARSTGTAVGGFFQQAGDQWDLAVKGRGTYTTTGADVKAARAFAAGGFDDSGLGRGIRDDTYAGWWNDALGNPFAGSGTEAGMRANLGDTYGTMAGISMGELRKVEKSRGRKLKEGKDYHRTADGKAVLQSDMDHAARQRSSYRQGAKVSDDTRRALHRRHTVSGKYSKSDLDDMLRDKGLLTNEVDEVAYTVQTDPRTGRVHTVAQGSGRNYRALGGKEVEEGDLERARLFAAADDMGLLTRYDEEGNPVSKIDWETFNAKDDAGRKRRLSVQQDVAAVLKASGYDDKRIKGVFGINAGSNDLGSALTKEGAKKNLDIAIDKLFGAEASVDDQSFFGRSSDLMASFGGGDSSAGSALRGKLQKSAKARGLMSNFLNAMKTGDDDGMADAHMELMEELGPESAEGKAMSNMYKTLMGKGEGGADSAAQMRGALGRAAGEFGKASKSLSYNEVVTQNLKRQENAMAAFIRRKRPDDKFMGSNDSGMANAVKSLRKTLTTVDPTARQEAVEGLMQQVFKDQKMSQEESTNLRDMLGSNALVAMGADIEALSGESDTARTAAVKRILGKDASGEAVKAALSEVGEGDVSGAIGLLKKKGMLDTGLFGAGKGEKSTAGSVSEMVDKNTQFVQAVDTFLNNMPEYITDAIEINVSLQESPTDDDDGGN